MDDLIDQWKREAFIALYFRDGEPQPISDESAAPYGVSIFWLDSPDTRQRLIDWEYRRQRTGPNLEYGLSPAVRALHTGA